jgi:hypothetical protein
MKRAARSARDDAAQIAASQRMSPAAVLATSGATEALFPTFAPRRAIKDR